MNVYELSHPFITGMPHHVAVSPFLHVFQRRLGDVVRPGGVSLAADMLIAPLHSGTHIDAPSHAADESEVAVARPSGEDLPTLLGRAVLIDCRSAVADGAYELSASDLSDALDSAGTAVLPGDVALIATGWDQHWPNPDAYAGPAADPPGLSLAAATFLADAGVVAIGSDTATVEPRSTQNAVHRDVLSRRGVYLIENLHLEPICSSGEHEMLFLALPLRIVGATASPLRCVALTGEGMPHALAFFQSASDTTATSEVAK